MAGYWKVLGLSEKATSPAMGEWPARAPGPDEVVVRLRAAALNFADLLMLDGRYQDTPPRPFIPGLEGAGEVIEAGPEAGLAPGTRVAVYSQGTMAEANVFPAAHCVPIPDTMGWAEAAGFLIAYGTSHLALSHRAGLRAGDALAVLGAAGGVGLTVVEIGAALGARVIAVARGAARLGTARAAGATETIDSETCLDLRAALRALGGVDVVYDPVGDALGEAAFGALRPGGHAVIVVCPSNIRQIAVEWHEAFAQMAEQLPAPARMEQIETIERAIDDSRRILPYMNAGPQLAQRMRREFVLVLRKPAAAVATGGSKAT